MNGTASTDDLAAFVSLARKAGVGTLSGQDHVDLVKWVGDHGEGLLCTRAEVERQISEQASMMRDLHQVQRGQATSIRTLISSLDDLTRAHRQLGEKLKRIEQGLWSVLMLESVEGQPRD